MPVCVEALPPSGRLFNFHRGGVGGIHLCRPVSLREQPRSRPPQPPRTAHWPTAVYPWCVPSPPSCSHAVRVGGAPRTGAGGNLSSPSFQGGLGVQRAGKRLAPSGPEHQRQSRELNCGVQRARSAGARRPGRSPSVGPGSLGLPAALPLRDRLCAPGAALQEEGTTSCSAH